MLTKVLRNFMYICSGQSNLPTVKCRNIISSFKETRFIKVEPLFSLSSLFSSSSKPPDVTEGEKRIKLILKKNFPDAVEIKVRDVSGGCGSMYTVGVCSRDFKNLSIVKQHRLVHEALKNEIKDMHGIQVETTIP